MKVGKKTGAFKNPIENTMMQKTMFLAESNTLPMIKLRDMRQKRVVAMK